MHAVMFVLPDEMADVSITGLQWFILIPQLNHMGSHRPNDSHSKSYYIEKKIYDLEQELPSLLLSYELREKQLFLSDFSRLLRHALEKGRGPFLSSKKTRYSTGVCEFGIRTHLLCCAYRLDIATELTGQAISSGRVIQFIVFFFFSVLIMGTLCKILIKAGTFFVMLHIHVYNFFKKVFH